MLLRVCWYLRLSSRQALSSEIRASWLLVVGRIKCGAHRHNLNCTYIPNCLICFVVVSCVVSQLTTRCRCHLPKFDMVSVSGLLYYCRNSSCCSRIMPSMFLRTVQLITVRLQFMMTFFSVCALHPSAVCRTNSANNACDNVVEGQWGPVRLSRSAVTRSRSINPTVSQ